MSDPEENDAADEKRRALFAAFDDAFEPEGFTLGGYDVLGEIDRGGMASVYHARQITPEREVALKVMLPKFSGDRSMRARFQTEARAMAALDHPGILPIYQVGESKGMPFFSMKIAEGGTLASRLVESRPPIRESVEWMISVSAAVHYAHQRGVLHRDLKPGNFLFDDQGRIYVGDFGVAKMLLGDDGGLTKTEAFIGTPYYMAPEIAGGAASEASVAGDLYGIGAVLYECLTGQRPHPEQANVASLLRAIVDDPIAPPRSLNSAIPLDLEVICLKALEKDPARRYASVADLRDDLIRWREGRVILARPIGLARRLTRWIRRHPVPAALVAALILMAVTGGILLSKSYYDQRQALQKSLIERAVGERRLAAPGFRSRALDLLKDSAALADSPGIREEAIAVLAKIDITLDSTFQKPPPAPISERSADGRFHLVKDDLGALELRRDLQTIRHWSPEAGYEIRAAFSSVRSGGLVIVGAMPKQLLHYHGPDFQDHTGIPVSGSQTFLQMSPDGLTAAIRGEEGLEVIDLARGEVRWRSRRGDARCIPAWSPDGRFLAAALGESKGVVVYEAATGREYETHRISDWPAHLHFHPDGQFLIVVGSQRNLSVVDLPADRILAELPLAGATPAPVVFSALGDHFWLKGGEGAAWQIHRPVGYREFIASMQTRGATTVFDAAFSPDEKWLLTVTTLGVQLWNPVSARHAGFHAAENQTIDARTDAWWLSENEILVQVPGGLGKLTVTETGELIYKEDVLREPGTRILEVTPVGDWLVAVLNEDEEQILELWPAGDLTRRCPAASQSWIRPSDLSVHDASGSLLAEVLENETISFTPSGNEVVILTPHDDVRINHIFLTADRRRLIGISEGQRVFEWDLKALEESLESLGF